ncbi:MAG: ABC transporter ATP-binding protein [Desulfurococcaceae archaeon]
MKIAKVRVVNVTKRFGDLVAVNNVSFEVYEGEIFTLLGPSGCGKTTTLRIISGLEKPDSGKIYIGDNDVTALPPQLRNVCLVFQEYAVFPHMSVYDNIAFGLKVKRVPKEELSKKVRELAEVLELTDRLNTKAGKLGISEQQRIALARCMAVEPEVLLLDEPLTFADAKVREKMRRELKKIQRELGVTMIYVTHDQLEAMMLSDRIAVMNKGRLLQVGSPIEVYDNPQNLFVARFIGSPTINTIEGVLVRERERLLIKRNEVVVDVSEFMSSYHNVESLLGREIVIGIRPEDVYLDISGPIEGVVEVIEVSGERLAIHVRVSKELVLKALVPIYEVVTEREKVRLSFNLEKVHIFDKATEEKVSSVSKVKY